MTDNINGNDSFLEETSEEISSETDKELKEIEKDIEEPKKTHEEIDKDFEEINEEVDNEDLSDISSKEQANFEKVFAEANKINEAISGGTNNKINNEDLNEELNEIEKEIKKDKKVVEVKETKKPNEESNGEPNEGSDEGSNGESDKKSDKETSGETSLNVLLKQFDLGSQEWFKEMTARINKLENNETDEGDKGGKIDQKMVKNKKDYITKLEEYKVFLKKRSELSYLSGFCDILEFNDTCDLIQKKIELEKKSKLAKLAKDDLDKFNESVKRYRTEIQKEKESIQNADDDLKTIGNILSNHKENEVEIKKGQTAPISTLIQTVIEFQKIQKQKKVELLNYKENIIEDIKQDFIVKDKKEKIQELTKDIMLCNTIFDSRKKTLINKGISVIKKLREGGEPSQNEELCEQLLNLNALRIKDKLLSLKNKVKNLNNDNKKNEVKNLNNDNKKNEVKKEIRDGKRKQWIIEEIILKTNKIKEIKQKIKDIDKNLEDGKERNRIKIVKEKIEKINSIKSLEKQLRNISNKLQSSKTIKTSPSEGKVGLLWSKEDMESLISSVGSDSLLKDANKELNKEKILEKIRSEQNKIKEKKKKIEGIDKELEGVDKQSKEVIKNIKAKIKILKDIEKQEKRLSDISKRVEEIQLKKGDRENLLGRIGNTIDGTKASNLLEKIRGELKDAKEKLKTSKKNKKELKKSEVEEENEEGKENKEDEDGSTTNKDVNIEIDIKQLVETIRVIDANVDDAVSTNQEISKQQMETLKSDLEKKKKYLLKKQEELKKFSEVEGDSKNKIEFKNDVTRSNSEELLNLIEEGLEIVSGCETKINTEISRLSRVEKELTSKITEKPGQDQNPEQESKKENQNQRQEQKQAQEKEKKQQEKIETKKTKNEKKDGEKTQTRMTSKDKPEEEYYAVPSFNLVKSALQEGVVDVDKDKNRPIIRKERIERLFNNINNKKNNLENNKEEMQKQLKSTVEHLKKAQRNRIKEAVKTTSKIQKTVLEKISNDEEFLNEIKQESNGSGIKEGTSVTRNLKKENINHKDYEKLLNEMCDNALLRKAICPSNWIKKGGKVKSQEDEYEIVSILQREYAKCEIESKSDRVYKKPTAMYFGTIDTIFGNDNKTKNLILRNNDALGNEYSIQITNIPLWMPYETLIKEMRNDFPKFMEDILNPKSNLGKRLKLNDGENIGVSMLKGDEVLKGTDGIRYDSTQGLTFKDGLLNEFNNFKQALLETYPNSKSQFAKMNRSKDKERSI